MLFTYTAEVELDKDYGICANCKIEMEWNTIFKPAYMRMTSGSNSMVGTCTTSVNTGVASCTAGQNLDGGANIKFTFYDVLVKTTVASG